MKFLLKIIILCVTFIIGCKPNAPSLAINEPIKINQNYISLLLPPDHFQVDINTAQGVKKYLGYQGLIQNPNQESGLFRRISIGNGLKQGVLEICLQKESSISYSFHLLEEYRIGGNFEFEVHVSKENIQISPNEWFEGSNIQIVLKNNKDVPTCSRDIFLERKTKNHEISIFFTIIDSLRSDVISQAFTPHLWEFSRENTLFKKQRTNSAWTRPSTLSFLTGLYPSRTGVSIWDYPLDKAEIDDFHKKKILSLPKLLTELGYRTIFIGNNPFLLENNSIGVDLGFQEVYDYSLDGKDTIHIREKSIQFIQNFKNSESNKDRPIFLFVNFNDPHKPYTPPVEYLEGISDEMDERKKGYLGEVRFVDYEWSKILNEWKNLFQNQANTILITSDHGEVMSPSHAISKFTGSNTLYGHGQGLYEEDIAVPLIWKFPNGKNIPKEWDFLTRHIDIFPTILGIIQIQPDPSLPGIDLVGHMQRGNFKDLEYYGETRACAGIRVGDLKILKKTYSFHRLGTVWSGSVGPENYYRIDLSKDPEENSPVLWDEKVGNISQDWIDLKKKLDQMLPEDPKYNFIYSGSENTELVIQVDAGTIQYNGNSYGKFLRIPLAPNSVMQNYFTIHPSIALPKIQHTSKSGILPMYVGSHSVRQTDLNQDNLPLWESFSKPPVSRDQGLQIWKDGGIVRQEVRREDLGREALDELKKQGYVQ
jgi:arylsulfatase A-like enzyme